MRSSKLVRDAVLKVYPGAPHGLADTHRDQLNADLLEFLRTRPEQRQEEAVPA
jgi:non-heme chloroperoxidase